MNLTTMKAVAIEKLGKLPPEQETRLLKEVDAAFSCDEGIAVRAHLAAGRPIYFRERHTPAGHVVRRNPDGSRVLVKFTDDGAEVEVGDFAAA